MSKALESMRAFEEFNQNENRVEYVFGTLPVSEIVEAKFTLKEFSLESIQAGCGCTDAGVEGNVVSAKLNLSQALSENQKSTSGIYPVTKAVTVWFDDGIPEYTVDERKNRVYNPDKMRTTLFIKGNVKV